MVLLVLLGFVITACGTRVDEASIIRFEGADGTAVTTVPGGPVGTGGTGEATTGTPGQTTGTTGATTGTPGQTTGTTGSTGATTGTPGQTTGTTTTGTPGQTTGTPGQTTGTQGQSTGTPGQTTGTTGNPVAQGCAKQGPPVVIGQVATLSGLVGSNFAGAIKTPYVVVNYLNSRGGLGCHPIKFIQIDDQSNAAASQAAVERLVNKEGAVAIFAPFVPLDAPGFLSGITKTGVPAFGGDQAATEMLGNKLWYPVGATSRASIAGSVKQAAEAGGKKIAVFNCIEASPCGSNFSNTIIRDKVATKFGMEVVATGSISILSPDFTSQCQNAKSAGADTVAFGLDKAGLQRAAKSCASLGYFPKLPLIALQGAFDPKDPNIIKSGAFLSSPTFPYLQEETPAQKEFRAAMKQFAPEAPIDTPASLVWADGMMLAKVIENLGPSAQGRALTKADFIAGAAKIKNETLGGLIPATTYKAVGPQNEINCYFGIRFKDGKFTAPNGSKPTCLDI